MIAHSKTKGGKLLSHGTAKITSDPQYRETSTGKQVTSFYVLSDAVGFGKNLLQPLGGDGAAAQAGSFLRPQPVNICIHQCGSIHKCLVSVAGGKKQGFPI